MNRCDDVRARSGIDGTTPGRGADGRQWERHDGVSAAGRGGPYMAMAAGESSDGASP